MEIFESTVNEFQQLAFVTKTFVVDGTGVLGPRDQTLNRLKISPSQVSHQALCPLCFSCKK